ncbi:MAG: site-2 protease family protein [Chloroflexi bacterium]|nr:site-2 protease family protein [Chloroflexota bacterium]MBI5080690.1 site-2 protease family protein [Chloroflexota bacterium]
MLGLSIPELITNAITLIIAITVHEFAHAYVADQLGDPLPRSQGRVTLDPRSHLDPIGSLMMVFVGFGWGRPVLTNPFNYRMSVRSGMAIVAAAGPFSNFILAMLAAIPFRLRWISSTTFANDISFLPSFADFLFMFIWLNIGLMLFNLIPIAPLDGFKVALGVLPDEWANKLATLEQFGPILLMVVLIGGRGILGLLMSPLQQTIFSLLIGR